MGQAARQHGNRAAGLQHPEREGDGKRLDDHAGPRHAVREKLRLQRVADRGLLGREQPRIAGNVAPAKCRHLGKRMLATADDEQILVEQRFQFDRAAKILRHQTSHDQIEAAIVKPRGQPEGTTLAHGDDATRMGLGQQCDRLRQELRHGDEQGADDQALAVLVHQVSEFVLGRAEIAKNHAGVAGQRPTERRRHHAGRGTLVELHPQ